MRLPKKTTWLLADEVAFFLEDIGHKAKLINEIAENFRIAWRIYNGNQFQGGENKRFIKSPSLSG